MQVEVGSEMASLGLSSTSMAIVGRLQAQMGFVEGLYGPRVGSLSISSCGLLNPRSTLAYEPSTFGYNC